MKLHCVFALALGLAALPASAQTVDTPPAAAAPAIKGGETVFSAEGRRIGSVDRVRGTMIVVIGDAKPLYIPISTLTATDRGLVTSLTRKELNKL